MHFYPENAFQTDNDTTENRPYVKRVVAMSHLPLIPTVVGAPCAQSMGMIFNRLAWWWLR